MAQKFSNAARATLTAGISNTDTSLTISSGLADLFPVANTGTSAVPTVGLDYYKIVLQNTSGQIEIAYVRTRALGSAVMSNILRGQEGTTALAFLAGSVVGLRHTANDLAAAIDLAANATTPGKNVLNAASAAAQRSALAFSTLGDTLATIADAASARAAIKVGVVDQNSQSAAYTTVLADGGKHILHPSADTTARVFTIPANASVAYDIGTAITFVNQNGAGVLTIAINTDTMRMAGTGSTGSRTLAANGVATALKLTATEWIISGTGLT